MANLTKEQIEQALAQGVSREQIERYMSTGSVKQDFDFSAVETIKNIPGSAGRLVKDVGSALLSPIETGKALGGLALGGVQKLIPGEQKSEENFDALVDFYKNRYGSFEDFQKALQEDPVGVAADASVILGGTGAALRGVGLASKSSTLAQVGKAAGTVGRAVDPFVLGTKAVGGAVSKTGQKLKGRRLVEADEGLIKLSREKGVELPVSSYVPNKAVQAAEALVGRGVFGRRIEQIVEKSEKAINSVVDDFVRGVADKTDEAVLGVEINKRLSKFRQTWIKEKNKLYEAAEARHGVNVKVKPVQTLKVLDDAIDSLKSVGKVDKKGVASELSDLKRLKNNLSKKGGIPAKALRDYLRRTNEKKNSFGAEIPTGSKAELRRLLKAIDNDLTQTYKGTPYEAALKKADDAYQAGLNTFNSEWGIRVRKLAKEKPEKIVESIIKPGMTEMIDDIYRVVGPETKAKIQATFLEKMITKATNAEGTLVGSTLSNQMKRWSDPTLRKVLDPQQYKSLQEVRKLAQGLQKGQAIAKGSQTAFITRVALVGWAMFGNPAMAVQILLGDAALSRFITSKAGRAMLIDGIQAEGRLGEKIRQWAPRSRIGGQALLQTQRLEQ